MTPMRLLMIHTVLVFLSGGIVTMGARLDRDWLLIGGVLLAIEAGRWSEKLTQRVRGKR